MSNFNDLYDHVAADRSRAMQLLGIQDIRRKAVAELLAAGAYTEPDNIDDMTDAEREQHKAEAAYGLGRPHILEAAKMPVQDGDETYAIAVTATSEHPNCIALCIQTKLEELYASGIVDRSANHRPRLFVVAANDRPDEDVQGLSTALDMLRVAYPDFHIELSERTPEQAMRAALAEDLRDALDACKINASKENFQRLAATMIAAPLFFPAQRPEGEAAPEDGQQHLQFGKVRTDDGRTFFCAFTDRARLLQWRNMGSVELGVKDYAPLVLSSNDTGIIIDPGVGSGLALTREMLQTLKAQLEFFDQMRNTAAEMGVEVPYEELPSIQKELIGKCRLLGKRVITATEMLESMTHNIRPTRAEIADVANAVYDGTSAIMLSGETAAGEHPVEALSAMARIAEYTEAHINYAKRFPKTQFEIHDTLDAISHATCGMAIDIGAKVITVCSITGRTARLISRFRGPTDIIGLTTNERAYRKLALSWGITPVMSEVYESTDVLFYHALQVSRQVMQLEKGDKVIITGGIINGRSGNTNTIKVEYA